MKGSTNPTGDTRLIGGVQADIGRLPAVIENRPSRVAGLVVLVFGAIFTAIPLTSLVYGIRKGEFDAIIIALLFFVLVGGLVLSLGLYLFTSYGRVTISLDEVHSLHKSIFGKKEWREPLANYQGLLHRSETRSGSRNSSSYTVYVIWLWHERFSRSIQLAESRVERGMREAWESMCRHLNLPALQMDGERILERSPDDLDKSVAELASEGKLDLRSDLPSPAPPTLDVRESARGIEIVIVPQPIKALPIVFGIVMGGVFFYISTAFHDAPAAFGYIGLGFGALFVFALMALIFRRSTLLLTREGIEMGKRTPFGNSEPTKVPKDDIESVTVTFHEKTRCLQIATDKERHHLGKETNKATLEWLRDRILRHLADAASK